MKTLIRPILIISLALLGGSLGLRPAAAQSNSLKKWTVMVYLDGDNDLEEASIDDFNEMEQVGTSPDVNIVVEWDRWTMADSLDTGYAGDTTQSWETTRRYLVQKDPNQVPDPLTGQVSPFANRIFSPYLVDLGEANMGDMDELVDFVRWTISRFPAENYFLILWDHGGGWKPRARTSRGVVWDDTDGSDFLTDQELKQGMAKIKQDFLGGDNLRLLGMDACLMGMVEVAYQVRDSVDFLISSQLVVPFDGFPYDTLLEELTDDPGQRIERFLEKLVTFYVDSYRPGQSTVGAGGSVTLAAQDLSRLSPLVQTVDELAVWLWDNLRPWIGQIARAREQAQSSDPLFNMLGGDSDNRDVFDLAQKLQDNIDDPELERLTEAVQDAVEGPSGVVIAEGHLTGTSPSDPNMDNSHGLSIYFPPNGDFLDPLYIQVLDFPDDNQWDEFLQAYINLFDDTQGPQVFISFPSNGSTLQNTQPTIMATLTDVGGGRVDPSTIELTFDGKLVDLEDLTFDIATGQLQYQPPTTLAATTHTIKLTVKDLAGNPGQTAFVSFRIAPLVLKRGIQLLSIPLKLDTADPTVVFGAQDFTLVRWLPNDTRTSKYRFYPDPYASLIPPDADPNQTTTPIVSQPPAGLGYWVKLPTDTPALLGAGDVVDAPNGYAVRLLRGPGLSGWNLLGNPFNESIGWSSVQFRREGRRLTLTRAVEAGWTTGVLYGYAPNVLNPDMLGHYEFGGPGEGALDPWKAYWVQVNEDVEVIIFPGSGVGSRSTPGELVPAAPVGGWQIQLIAVTPEGEDPCNYVGLAVGAEEGRDAQDIAEPPPLGPDQVRLSLPHREWKGRAAGDYARDLRPAGAKRVEWTVEVQSPAGPPEVTLRWKGLPTVPPEYHLFLEDETAQQTVFLKTQSAYRFTPSPAGETRRFRLRAEHTATRTALKIVGLSVQRTRGDSYGASYTLTLPAQVQVQVLSITGRPVATVLEQTRAAGTHTETWDGRDGWGRPLPNGYYLIEVTARTETNEMDRAIGGISMVR